MTQNTSSSGEAGATLRVGLVGLGHWGPNILRNAMRHPRMQLVCVCDTDPQAFVRTQALLPPDVRKVNTPDHLFRDPVVDAVIIATPAATHHTLAKAALSQGKHVLCEKPLALRTEEAQELCAIAEASGLRLMVGHTFLFNNSVLKVKELLEADRVGDIYYLVSARTHMGLVRSDVSVVWDLAPHDVVIMNYLVGAVPERVSAVAAQPLKLKYPDAAFITLMYPGGIVGAIQVSWVDSHKERMLTVIGDKGRIVFNDLDDLEPVRVFEKGIGVCDRVAPEFGEYKFLLRDGDIFSPKVHSVEPLAKMIDGFVKLVLDGVPTPSEGQSGLDITRVLVAAEKSIAQSGAPEPVQ